MHSEHKYYSLILLPTPPVAEWNMKGCKTNTHTYTHTHTHTHTRTHTHTHTHTHTKVDFLLQFVLADYAGFSFKCQMPKESLIILNNVLLHASAKLKQYEQLPKNYNSRFKMYCGFAA